jgi:hypothetical protein
MAITPKQILDTAVAVGREAVTKGMELAGKLRSDERAERPTTPAQPVRRGTPAPSGSPSTVGAAKPGQARGPKSATAGTARKPPANKAKAPAAKPSQATKTAASKSKRPKAQPAAASRKAGPTSKHD